MEGCRPVVIKAHSKGYPQYQSDKSIDRPSIWGTRRQTTISELEFLTGGSNENVSSSREMDGKMPDIDSALSGWDERWPNCFAHRGSGVLGVCAADPWVLNGIHPPFEILI
ncbi:hypothetical protein TNCV_3628581 [Trichonephila clavipes]|nr:hypothetical protein TNCV_3628581 [Trichonephila clavipes]